MAKGASMGAGSKKMGGLGLKPRMPMPPAGGMGGGGPMGPSTPGSSPGGAFKKGGPVKKVDAKKGAKKK